MEATSLVDGALDLAPKINDLCLPFEDFILTKYLNSQQRESFQKLPVDGLVLKAFVEKMNSPEGIPYLAIDIQNYKLYPLLGLRAFFNKDITAEQFGTLCMLYEGIEQMIVSPSRFELKHNYSTNEAEFHRLSLQNNQNNFLSSDIRVHSIYGTNNELRYLTKFFRLSEEGTKVLIQSMHDAPDSEKFFYTFEIPLAPTWSWSPYYNRFSYVMNFFGPVDAFQTNRDSWPSPSKPQLLVLPSFTLFKNFLKMGFPESYFNIEPVLGNVSTTMITHYKLNGIRLINVGIPGIDVPEMGDSGLYAGKLIFTFHDFYHALRDSNIPKNYQLALRRINKILRSAISIEKIEERKKELKKVKWKLMDGELFGIKGDGEFQGKFGTIFYFVRQHIHSCSIIIKDMVQSKQVWDHYSISEIDLENPEQKIYEKFQQQTFEK